MASGAILGHFKDRISRWLELSTCVVPGKMVISLNILKLSQEQDYYFMRSFTIYLYFLFFLNQKVIFFSNLQRSSSAFRFKQRKFVTLRYASQPTSSGTLA